MATMCFTNQRPDAFVYILLHSEPSPRTSRARGTRLLSRHLGPFMTEQWNPRPGSSDFSGASFWGDAVATSEP
ncbi:hypothetical protein ZHAS_00006216 [Anopheles sinensis]|uniref:Uncharacterized protein n=1 Tax=Anopheles sinensis TaxID=74873 RepID=A0A084VLQ5_ANOSI|nr:hypothetical protein ZHAS_00006216 [Anopheles sinensis]